MSAAEIPVSIRATEEQVSFTAWNASLGKRLFDFSIAGMGFLLATPLLLAIAILVKLTSRGPVLFQQFRVGQNGQDFKLLKFRSMYDRRKDLGPGLTANGDSRVTPVGRFLRKWKLDELPQLINVIRGEMSLIGPRPDLPEFIAQLTPETRKLIHLKPGITGAASLQYRNEESLLRTVSPSELKSFYINQLLPMKAALDIRYGQRASFASDLHMLVDTAKAAIFGAGSDDVAERPTTFDVVMMTTVHPALDARIFHREAVTLAEAGFSVGIVGRHEKSELVNGVWIEALPEPKNRVQRLRLGWTALRKVHQMRPRLAIFHDPELFWAGVLLRFSGHRAVYDCHENLPMQALQKEWIPSTLRGALVPVIALAEWSLARMVSGVIVAREAIKSRFPNNKTAVVRNFPKASTLYALGSTLPVGLRENVVIYAGVLSRVRGIGELVKAFEAPELQEAKLLLLGEFDETDFKNQILSAAPANVQWLGRKSYEDVFRYYGTAKVGAVLLHPTPSHRNSMPIKLFEYLGAGLLVIASDFPEFLPVVEGCGEMVNPLDVGQIRDTLTKLLSLPPEVLDRMSGTAKKRVHDSLNWEQEGQKLVSFCSNLIAPSWAASNAKH
jgi:lipopolysaccharide/colanic/teichoic acid biosynthesis glycosyltransferase/glycosyltransferase involved in cell wall biosynthesis